MATNSSGASGNKFRGLEIPNNLTLDDLEGLASLVHLWADFWYLDEEPDQKSEDPVVDDPSGVCLVCKIYQELVKLSKSRAGSTR